MASRRITVLEAVSQAAKEIGIAQTAVATVVGSLDQDVVQMASLLHAVADEVLLDEPYRRTLGDDVWIYDQDGNPKDDFTADTDIIAFDDRLAISGIKWRFKQAKGLEFGEEMRDFGNRLNKLSSRVNGRVLDLYADEGRVQ
jgi:hypothetical protein